MNLNEPCAVCDAYIERYTDDNGYTELEICKDCGHYYLPYSADCKCGEHE